MFGQPNSGTRKDRIMRSNLNKLMIAGLVTTGLAAATLAATVDTSSALPLAPGNQAVSHAAPAVTTDVHWRGRHGYYRHGYRGWGWGAGAAALGLGIAAATAPYYYGGYYGPRYGYYDPYAGGCWQDRWGRVWCR
jgi:hypothetical protein